jgi:hypothetical protein
VSLKFVVATYGIEGVRSPPRRPRPRAIFVARNARGWVRRRKAFASALDFVSADGVKNRARALGEAMREENGVANAVVELERIAAS